MKYLSTDHPVYIGFTGEAGSGKTSTAKQIVPSIRNSLYGDLGKPKNHDEIDIYWDHFWLSAPLYEIHAVRTQIVGEDVKDRTLYALHRIADAVMMDSIPYDDLIELVYDTYSFPFLDPEGMKPRSFLQQVGDLYLGLNPDCFANHIKHKIFKAWQSITLEYERMDLHHPLYLAIISDVRKPNEAKMIKDRTQHCLIKFVADEDTRRERLYDRDGTVLTASQSAHPTETSIAKIPEEWYDAIVDTTKLTLEEQVETVKEIVLGKTNA